MTINLSRLDISEIKYKISHFPDGQQDIVIDTSTILVGQEITIESRFNSFRDLELIICTTKALRRLGYRYINLYIPYLLGSRSDRHFQEGGNSYLVDVIAPIINAQKYESVAVLDAHSDVAAACINNLIVIDNIQLIDWAIREINSESLLLVSPDSGALKKIYNVAKHIGYKHEILIANKHREIETGKILSTEISIPLNSNSHFLIIDDICDGGRTFIELAKKIKEQKPIAKIWLVVSHGIFSAGLKELSQYFDCIYTTNSVMDINSNTEFGMHNEPYLYKVKQLNIL